MKLPFFFRSLRYRLFYAALLHQNYKLMELGSRDTECSWFFAPEGLNEKSVIYSGGVGKDITFEHALVNQFGSAVVLFDPSPTGAETMNLPENQNPKFNFHPVALADHCGKLNFAPPQNPEEGSWFTHAEAAETIEVPCVDLSTLMERNGHTHIDLIKIDIEGAEYGVIDDLLKRKIPVKQILVEYHHGMLPGIRRSQSIRSILKLAFAGYRLLLQTGNNHTFLHPKM